MITLCLALIFQNVDHEFIYLADKDRKSVAVAGTFNAWDRNANPMTVASDGKTWRAKIGLKPGRHEYKFVLDGADWITDPKASKNQDDGNGNINSVLNLLPADYAKPAARGDGALAASGLEHKTQAPSFNFDKGKLTLTLRTRAGDANSVQVKVQGATHSMDRLAGDDLYETYRTRLPWNGKAALEYVFLISDGTTFTYAADGLGGFKAFQVGGKNYQPFLVPNWVEGAVFYQVFPERFLNGNKANDPDGTLPWKSDPKYFNFMGGDLAGVHQKVEYLKSLGIAGIYLNPIFEGPSNHGYETSDYLKVAKRFGTNLEFKNLVTSFHNKGMKVVLDGVFNHTATTFAPFADIIKNEQKSNYLGWYWVQSFPVKVQDPPNYTAWFNFPSMPKVNLSNPDARKYFLDVPSFWEKEANIDGWRLDVANEVQVDFWKDFRKSVKKADPNSWIVGEVWGDGSQWLGGDQWDSIMGYQFRDAALRFVAEDKISASDFLASLMRTYNSYAPQVSRNLMNLLSSHDTPRFITSCGGDKELARLGAALLLTWPGSPSIYYGEELGMEGGADPDNRRGMAWEMANGKNETLSYYQKLIQLRMSTPVLRTGEPQMLTTNDTFKTLAFARVEGDDVAIVAVNRDSTAHTMSIPLRSLPQKAQNQEVRDALGAAEVRLEPGSLLVTLAPKSAAVLLPSKSTSTRYTRTPNHKAHIVGENQ